jgi:hypothetical protein
MKYPRVGLHLFFNWLLTTDAGLLTRIGIGGAIFATLAAVDLARRGPAATRWREYLFLLVVVLAAIVYGAVNDAVGSAISWEYFYGPSGFTVGKDPIHHSGSRSRF